MATASANDQPAHENIRASHRPLTGYRYSLPLRGTPTIRSDGDAASDVFAHATELVHQRRWEYGRALLDLAWNGAPQTDSGLPALPGLKAVRSRVDCAPIVRAVEARAHESNSITLASERADRRINARSRRLHEWIARIARWIGRLIPRRFWRDSEQVRREAAFRAVAAAHISAGRAEHLFPPAWGLVKQIRKGEYTEPAALMERIGQGQIQHLNGGTFDAPALFDQHPGMFGDQRFRDATEFFDAVAGQRYAARQTADNFDSTVEMDGQMARNPELRRLHAALWGLEKRGLQEVGSPESTVAAARAWFGLRGPVGLTTLLTSIEPDQIALLSDSKGGAAWAFWRATLAALEREGYMKHDEGHHWRLGAHGARIHGRRALTSVLREIRSKDHLRARANDAGEVTAQTHRHRYGEPFEADVAGTLLNAVRRGGVPLRLRAEDFEVSERETVHRTATALLVDYSASMHRDGALAAADTMTAALYELIRSTHSRDEVATFAFAEGAREVPAGLLIHGGQINLGTHETLLSPALRMALAWLRQRQVEARHITIVTDGVITDRGGVVRQIAACRRQSVSVSAVLTRPLDEHNSQLQHAVRSTGGTVTSIQPGDMPAYVVSEHVANR